MNELTLNDANVDMTEVTQNELENVDGGLSGWLSIVAGAGAAVGCLASGGAALGPIGWGGCAVGGALIGVGSYIL
jgi:lactobin A/cerein 7B family class IIb bacteriocin